MKQEVLLVEFGVFGAIEREESKVLLGNMVVGPYRREEEEQTNQIVAPATVGSGWGQLLQEDAYPHDDRSDSEPPKRSAE